jgi:hypothetical protein
MNPQCLLSGAIQFAHKMFHHLRRTLCRQAIKQFGIDRMPAPRFNRDEDDMYVVRFCGENVTTKVARCGEREDR